MSREDMVEIFEDSMRMCRTDPELARSVAESIARQNAFSEKWNIPSPSGRGNRQGRIVVSRKRTFEAAEAYKGKRVCCLNFASSKNPGGGVERGASAQEECLCRISTLFPCLSDEKMLRYFYKPHRHMFEDTLYNDDIIYTPDVTVFKTDTQHPEARPREEWFRVDVLTCAAPNLSSYTRVDSLQLERIHSERGRRIFHTAINEGAEVLILGAFGCGAFANPPEIVASVYKALNESYAEYFDTIEYAVYCSPKNTHNYDVFKQIEPNI